MSNILDVTVSCFPRCYEADKPHPISLYTWLTSSKHRATVDAIRSLADKKERDRAKKNGLPVVTVSGLFSKRDTAFLVQHSGFICLDIDGKDNTHLADFARLKSYMMHLSFVAYCGFSVSGTGYYVIVPIAYPERHEQQFKSLQGVFLDMGIIVDPSGIDTSRARFYSYDPDAWFNQLAQAFTGLYQPPAKAERRETGDYSPSDTRTTQSKVEDVINQLRQQQADITSDPRQWFEMGCALANEFGEWGRDYYHEVSQFYAGYQSAETNKRFDYALTKRYRFNIGTFFKYCADAGFVPQRLVTTNRPRWTLNDQTIYGDVLTVERCNEYPPEWDDPPAPDTRPRLRVQSAAEWLTGHYRS